VKPHRKGKGWQARWYESSTGKVRGKTFKTKREAELFASKMDTAQQFGDYVDPAPGRKTLEAWWRDYIAKAGNLRPATRAAYTGAMTNHVFPYLGGRKIGSLRRVDIEDWRARLRDEGRSTGTIHLAYRVLRRVLQAAVEWELIPRNPAAGMRLKGTDRQGAVEMRVLDPDEIGRLTEAVAGIKPRYRALISFMAYTGLRIGEAAALRIENLDLLRREVRVVSSVSVVNGHTHVGPTKTGFNRVVTLPKLVVSELERHLEEYPPQNGLVFGGPKDAHLSRHNFSGRVWQPALKRANLGQVRIHDLRHTAVSLAIRAGANAREIQARAGHSSITVTMNTYGHLMPGAERDVADRLDRLAQSWPQQDDQGASVARFSR
jgi:integrase